LLTFSHYIYTSVFFFFFFFFYYLFFFFFFFISFYYWFIFLSFGSYFTEKEKLQKKKWFIQYFWWKHVLGVVDVWKGLSLQLPNAGNDNFNGPSLGSFINFDAHKMYTQIKWDHKLYFQIRSQRVYVSYGFFGPIFLL